MTETIEGEWEKENREDDEGFLQAIDEIRRLIMMVRT